MVTANEAAPSQLFTECYEPKPPKLAPLSTQNTSTRNGSASSAFWA